jgi:hypothetical protein
VSGLISVLLSVAILLFTSDLGAGAEVDAIGVCALTGGSFTKVFVPQAKLKLLNFSCQTFL